MNAYMHDIRARERMTLFGWIRQVLTEARPWPL